MNVQLLAAEVVAKSGNGPEFGKSSPLGLLMILLLLVAAGFLGWSMSKHLRKLPESFDDEPDSTVEGSGSGEANTSENVDAAAKVDGDGSPQRAD